MSETGGFAGQSSHINFDDLNLLEEIGRGAFGTVQRAVLHGEIITAVKVIDIGNGVQEYEGEVRQLSKVHHENIIQLYGTSKDRNKIYIVMEFADCGSLYDLLHPAQEEDMIEYTLGHVVRWSLQCARAVEYLHSLKPIVVHRDLKPPNMLLTELGTVVKICDFGTATAIKTEMTSNKGSAAWMAPEVFEGRRYSEKCDVYSFGIILWEMLSRKKPFDEIGTPAFRILWAVYNGTRPPPLQGIPECLHNLMNNCWAKDAAKRPSFSELVKFLTVLDSFIEGADEPIFETYEQEPYNAYDDPHVISIKPTETPPVTPDYGAVFPAPDHLFEHPYQRYPGPAEVSPPYVPPSFKLANPQSPTSYMSPTSPSAMEYNRGEVEPVEIDPNEHVNWSVVPTHLMPVQPIANIPQSVKLYNNYMEQLRNFIDCQVRVDNLKVQKKNYESQIQEVTKTQQDSQKYLEKYVKLANDKSELLTHYNMMKTFLEGEKRRMAMNNPRVAHKTP